MKQYEPKVQAMLKDSQDLVESSKLDKTDIDGVDKTKNALNTRWKAVNDHLKDREQKWVKVIMKFEKGLCSYLCEEPMANVGMTVISLLQFSEA